MMLKVNGIQFETSLDEVLDEMIKQIHANGIDYLDKAPRKSGDNIQIQCPYHGNGHERRPSAGLRIKDGVFHCFACGETHSLPEFITHCFDRDNDMFGNFGLEWLLKNFLMLENEDRHDIKLDFHRVDFRNNRTNSKENDTGDSGYVSDVELDKYRYYHPYWEKRGIQSEHIIELFDLGYDKESNSITFPVRDIDGNCLFVARRSVLRKFFNYPSGVTKPLYGLYEITQTLKRDMYLKGDWDLYVCESMLDCLRLWQCGYISVALNGLGNDLQMKQLSEMPCRHICLATDNDERGLAARGRIKQAVKGKIFSEINFPDNIKDVGDCTDNQLVFNFKQWEKYV